MSIPKPGEGPRLIQARPHGETRPRWSVMIPVCNRLTFLEQSLRSILSQDPGSDVMQIEVVDNSTNNPGVETFVRTIGGERISYFRQAEHLTMGANWNLCIERSRGELVHIIHDDDYVAPGFYSAMAELAGRYPDAGLLFSRAFIIDESNTLNSITSRLEWLEEGSHDVAPNFGPNLISCPGVVVRRRTYEELGGFDDRLGVPTDYEMWMRGIIALGGAALREPLAFYREHSLSMTSESVLTGRFWWEIWSAGQRIRTYAPALDSERMQTWIERSLIKACEVYDQEGKPVAAGANFRVFWKITSGRGVIWWLLHRAARGRWRQLTRECLMLPRC